jgi:hypothetical protein
VAAVVDKEPTASKWAIPVFDRVKIPGIVELTEATPNSLGIIKLFSIIYNLLVYIYYSLTLPLDSITILEPCEPPYILSYFIQGISAFILFMALRAARAFK